MGGVGGNFTQSPLPEGAFRVRLPLFRGYTEWLAVKGARSFVDQREQEKKFLELQTFADVASLYFNVLLFQKNVEIVEKAIKLSQDRLGELRRFVRLGRSRKSELLELENSLAILESEKLDTLKQIADAKNGLESLVGEPIPGFAPIENFLELRPASKETLDVKARHDVLARQAAIDVARTTYKGQFSQHFPGIDSNFNYYTQRSGIREGIDWDLNLGIEMPLFSWGATHYAAKEAKAVMKQTQLDYERTVREAMLELQNIWDELETNLKKNPILKKSVQLTGENYDLQAREYRLGLVNNFQVLDALSDLHDAELSYEKLQLETSFQVIRLFLAQGKLPRTS